MDDRPPFDEFNEAMIAAVAETIGGDDLYGRAIVRAMRREGARFDYSLHGIDSLDMLDITFVGAKRLGVRIGLEEAAADINSGRADALTTGLLYRHTRYREDE